MLVLLVPPQDSWLPLSLHFALLVRGCSLLAALKLPAVVLRRQTYWLLR